MGPGLSYQPFSVSGAQRVAVATWADLQREVEAATGPIYVTLSGSLTADTPLVVSSKPSLVVVAGPADITCSDSAGSSAFVIQRSPAVMLQDLTISGCSGTAITVNSTAGATAPAPITTAAGGGRAMPAPIVVLKNVAVSSCSCGRGAAVAASSSRVVLDGCSFSNNTAQGCGAGLFADRAAVLVLNSEFTNNQGSSAGGFGDSCRGGAIHAQRSWLGAARSSFSGNRAANGSAVLLLQPVGMSQLQDCSFESNQPRPGTSADFVSSSGAVGLVGAGVTHVLQRGVSDCEPVKDGLTVARCTFSNNTAEINGGRGGSISVNDAYLAVINTTFVGPAANSSPPAASQAGLKGKAGKTPQRQEMALNGGCIGMDSSTLYVAGSRFSRCSAHLLGGAISMLRVTSVILDSVIDSASGDQGGAIRASNGYHLLRNVSVTNCHALNAGAGLWLEASDEMDVHMQGCTLEGNSLTGRGGALRAERIDEAGAVFVLSIHDSRFTRNTASFGAGLALLAADIADIRNNVFAHNTALQAGGGLWCSNKAVDTEGTAFRLTNNTWLNNTALIRGGGVITNPCNVTLHGDRFLGNSAAQEGGGLMVYGGEQVLLHNTQVSCNSAQQGAGVAVKLSDERVDSGVTIKCSSITANGVASDAAARQACMKGMSAAAALAKPASEALLAAAAAAAASPAAEPEAAGTDIGGGLWVARDQEAVLISSTIGGNRAVKAGAGVYLDKGAHLELSSSEAGMTAVSHNNCTAGSGGALFMNDKSELLAIEATLSSNRGTFGGAVFAMGNETYLELEAVTMNNNTAAAGGAVATLGGSTVNCTADCTFNFNQARVGGALMLHRGSSILASATLQGNIAAAATGAAAATAAATIYYKLGEVPTSAGGAVYAWMGALQLTRCTVSSNVAWGANGRGGGVFVHGASLQVKDTVFADNYASSAGGAVLLGPLGAHSLKVTRSNFTGNAARQYGGALAAGLLLPGDAAAANAQAVQREPDSSWRLQLSGTHFASNTAGKQGGALSCSLCDSVAITGSSFTSNAAVQTGGGISCVSCQAYITDGCSFLSNQAASGAGACILAAGDGSTTSNNEFTRNVASQAAAADASARLNAAAAAADHVATSHHGVPPNGNAATAAGSGITLLSSKETLPACGVVGTGGGMCLGLWDAGFSLLGRNSFSNNSAVYGAGLFIEACPEGAEQCPLLVDVGKLVFKGNALAAGGAAATAGVNQRRLLQAQGSDTGYWQSGPLSAHMINCPRRAACRRDAAADKRLACLQQQQLMLNNPEYSDDISAAIKGRRSGRALTPWDALREECRPILQQLAAGSTQPGSGPGQALPALIDKVLLGSNRHLLQGTAPLTQYLAFNSSEAIADAYATIMCAEGYQGRLCAHCLFPGTQQSGAWGSTFSGSCGKCSSRSVAASAYALSRLFDFAMVGLLIITTLVEMKKRRAEVVKARQAMLAKMAGKGGRAAGATPAASGGEGAGGGVSRPRGGSLEAPAGLSAGPFGESGTPGMMPPMREEEQPQPQPAAAGRATAGRPPREFIPEANESSAHGAASDGRAPGQPPIERIPGSGAAGYNGPTETPTPDYIATHAPVIVDPSVPQLHYQKPLQRVPLFVREVAGSSGGRKHAVACYTPASLQLGELFEVLKDFLQVLGILQTVLLSWQTAAAAATAATAAISGVNVTPMSTKAWISLDCLLPRTLDVARQLQLYHIAAQLLLPVCYALIVLCIFLAYAGYVSLRTRQPLWRGVLRMRLQAPIISSCLVMLSYFYPSVAYTVLGVFRCRYLDPSSGSSSSSVEGEVLRAPGWYWALDLERQCFVDGEHRALALGLGIPGALLLLAYPLAQALVLARRVAAGQVTGTSEFFARYGHLVEDFRPRLFFWASIVELRKLLLVAVVLGFESTGVLSQLMACGALLLGYCAALMGLLPYPYRLLNRLHLAAGGVLLAVVWINLYIATDGDAGDALSAAALGRRSLGLQLLSVVLVLAMVALLLLMFAVRVARQVKAVLDVDGDGRVSRADIDALLARLQREGGLAAKLLSCLGPRRRHGAAAAAATASCRGASASP
ncbi:hypothetical protein OEZ85_008662 [Tetradesmus obliquus]|uniref:EF-hand domain-containing protein n=1 Tax=Tetradesmus obliquus TaxID=3088 RepID=A0ABY8TJH1_TETOB|nr:hypothetical protein OEZ85_008662 [Tetradesmus obliquus]